MIRKATINDIPTIIEMGREFCVSAGWTEIVAYDDASIEASLCNMIEGENFSLLVACNGDEIIGMAGSAYSPFYFNYDHKTGSEMFFWINPAHRGRGLDLLDHMERDAREAGCASFSMGAMDRLRPEATGRLYLRRGYRPNEHTWIRRL